MSPKGSINRRVVLASRPHGLPTSRDFRLEEVDVPTPKQGQVLLRTLYLSLDPYMRQTMDEVGPLYARSVQLGEQPVAVADHDDGAETDSHAGLRDPRPLRRTLRCLSPRHGRVGRRWPREGASKRLGLFRPES